MDDVVLWIVVATALAFDFTNGFHDTANAVATSISTRAMPPRVAVSARGDPELRRRVPLARGRGDDRQRHRRGRPDHARDRVRRPRSARSPGTSRPGTSACPSSSSHALIGGVVGRGLRRRGRRRRARRRHRREGRGARRSSRRCSRSPSPAIAISLAYRIVGRRRPGPVSRGFRLGQIVSGSLFSLSHGTNDAQKTMGIIFLALVANGNLTRGRRRADAGSCSRRRPRSRSAPTSAAGGSSARWAAASSRWTRRRASPPRARAPR